VQQCGTQIRLKFISEWREAAKGCKKIGEAQLEPASLVKTLGDK